MPVSPPGRPITEIWLHGHYYALASMAPSQSQIVESVNECPVIAPDHRWADQRLWRIGSASRCFETTAQLAHNPGEQWLDTDLVLEPWQVTFLPKRPPAEVFYQYRQSHD